MTRGFIPYLLIMAGLWLGGFAQAAQFGQLDSSFVPEVATERGDLLGVSPANGDQYYVFGSFHRAGSLRRINLARMNADGSADETFDAGLSAVSTIQNVIVQTDGKVLVHGKPFKADGTPLPVLVRLHTDGSVDTSLQLPENIGEIESVHLLPNQQLLLQGLLLPTGNVAGAMLVRLTANGVLDPTFNSPIAGGYIAQVLPLANGKVAVRGLFYRYTNLNNLPPVGTPGRAFNTTVYHLQLLKEDGSHENIVPYPGSGYGDGPILKGGDDAVYEIRTTSPTGAFIRKIFSAGIAGPAHSLNFGDGSTLRGVFPLANDRLLVLVQRSSSAGGLAVIRMTMNGTPEIEYPSTLDKLGHLGTLKEFSDGSIVTMTRDNVYAAEQIVIQRFNADGTTDSSGLAETFRQTSGIKKIVLDQEQRIYLEESRRNSSNGLKHSQLRRFSANGTVDEEFNPSIHSTNQVSSPMLLPNGRLLAQASKAPAQGLKPWLVQLDAAGEVVKEQRMYDLGRSKWQMLSDGHVVIANLAVPEDIAPFSKYTAEFQPAPVFAPQRGMIGDDVLGQPLASPNGKLLVYRRSVNFYYGDEYLHYLMRLSADGTWDTNFFRSMDQDSQLLPLAVDDQERVYLARSEAALTESSYRNVPDWSRRSPFNIIWGTSVEPAVQRLKANGSVDPTFRCGLSSNSYVNVMHLQKDGRILVAGKLYSADGTKISALARLSPDGSLDETFVPPAGEVVPINAIAVETDGDILIGGNFDRIGNADRPGLARLKSMELLQIKNLAFTGGSISLQLGGNTGFTWLIQSSPDLLTWTTLSTVTTGTEAETIELPAPGSGNKFYRAVLAPEIDP